MESKLVPISQSKTQEHSASDALIRQWLFRFGVEHKEDVAPRLPLWLERFGGMKPEVLEPLFRKALDTCKFFPKVSDILGLVEHAKGNAIEEEAARRFELVLAYAVRRSPDYPEKNPPRISEHTRRGINAAGGLDWIRDCPADELQWARKRFIEAYVRYSELQQDEYLLPPGEVRDLLAGFAETKALPAPEVAQETYEEMRARGLAYAEQLETSPAEDPNIKKELQALHMEMRMKLGPVRRPPTSVEQLREAESKLGEKETDPATLRKLEQQKERLFVKFSRQEARP